MDCDTARHLLAFRRPSGPSELTPEDVAALDRHLAGCPGCAAVVGRQEGFDAAVGAAMRDVPVPAGLRGKLLKAAADREVTRFRRRVATYTAAAATALLAVFLAYGVTWANRPYLDPEGLVIDNDRKAESPELAVSDWLKSQGMPTDLPLDLEYRYYRWLGTEPVAGRNVPVIVFEIPQPNRGRPDTLTLYLVRQSDFRMDPMLPGAVGSFSTATVVKDDRKGSGIVYLARYNTPTLDPFLKRPSPAG